MLLPNRNLAPAYQKFDLSANYSVRPSLQIYTSIENLFSQHYEAAFGFPAAPFTIRSGLKFTLGGPGGLVVSKVMENKLAAHWHEVISIEPQVVVYY